MKDESCVLATYVEYMHGQIVALADLAKAFKAIEGVYEVEPRSNVHGAKMGLYKAMQSINTQLNYYFQNNEKELLAYNIERDKLGVKDGP